LKQSDFRKILKEPKNALVAQYQKLLGADGVDLQLTEDALEEVATIAAALNEKTQDIGARRLHTVMELLLQDILFQAPDPGLKSVVIYAIAVRSRLEPVLTPGSDVRYKL
jgi:ATP-dependent HslUV protease ATP-binding subunit HslU